MRNGGGDALDAVIAGVGAADALGLVGREVSMPCAQRPTSAYASAVRETKARYLCEGKQYI